MIIEARGAAKKIEIFCEKYLTGGKRDVIINPTVEQLFNCSIEERGEIMEHKVIPEVRESDLLCECEEVHADVVEEKRRHMPKESVLYDLSDLFKILGDSTRIRILFAIDGEPMCVCDIAQLLGMTKSAVSHQLKALRQSDLITYRKSGKNVFYSLADDHVRSIIETALEHINE